MPRDTADRDWPPVRYRAYLHLLSRGGLNERLRVLADPSEVVRQPLRQAPERIGQFRGAGAAELPAWLRAILAWSPDGAHLTTVVRDQTGRVWDVRSGQSVATLEGHTGAVNVVPGAPTASAWPPPTTRIRPESRCVCLVRNGSAGGPPRDMPGFAALPLGVPSSPAISETIAKHSGDLHDAFS